MFLTLVKMEAIAIPRMDLFVSALMDTQERDVI